MQGVNALDGAILMIAIVTARTPIVRPVVMPKIGEHKTCDRDQTAIGYQKTVFFFFCEKCGDEIVCAFGRNC